MNLRQSTIELLTDYFSKPEADQRKARAWLHGWLACAMKAGAIGLSEKHTADVALETDQPMSSWEAANKPWYRSPMYLCSTDSKGSNCEVIS